MTTIRSIRQPVATLSGGQRQSVAVARAVMWNSKLVILDEPTAALGVAQTEQVLALVKRLGEQGLAVILISHNLHDIFEVADRITVLRLGRNAGLFDRTATTQQEVVQAITAGAADEGLRHHDGRRRRVTTTAPNAAPAFDVAAPRREPRAPSSGRTSRAGTSAARPVIVGLTVIVIVFGFTAQNFFTAVNFNNIITQMAGTTMLAFGVVFVLLLGEIDLSIAYLSGLAGVVAAELQEPDSGHHFSGLWPIVVALVVATLIGAFQGSFVAIIGVPSFVVTLAGLLAWQGVIQVTLGAGGPIIIENRWINYTASYFFSTDGGLADRGILISAATSAAIALRRARQAPARRRDPLPVPRRREGDRRRRPSTFLVVAICNHDRGVPLAGLEIIFFLLFWTYIAKRTTFGRHVYAVGGNAEAARRAGISVAAHPDPRLHDLRASWPASAASSSPRNLRSVAPDQGGGTLLLDAISAAVIGGTSLFGGRGEVRSAVLGAAVIATIANGLFIFGFPPGVIYITTGCILLFAVTLDTIARRRQAKTGR